MLRRRGWILVVASLMISGMVPAFAEVSVSITITGPINELVPILQKLQELGLGSAAAANDPLKLNVHSTMSASDQAAKPAPAPDKAQPTFASAAVEPATAKPGESVLITAKVTDAGHAIDTVAATIGQTKVDLFDNGTEGDSTAGDGIWSRKVTLPATIAAGETAIAVNAYNANGEPVSVPGPNGEPIKLATQAKVTVTP